MPLKVQEIECKSAIAKCGFPGGGWAINPYVGCAHDCKYCYARFMKRFTGHTEEWGCFVDVRINIAEVLQKQMRSKIYQEGPIYISTVTDPYQPVEEKYQLTRKILDILKDFGNPVSILTKSDLVLRDLDLIKQFKNIDVNFTINTLDENWKKMIEPESPSIEKRIESVKVLTQNGIKVIVMMGPWWPFFSDAETMVRKFKEIGVKQLFSESFNAVGGNFTGVENVLKENYPHLLSQIKTIFFNEKELYKFYDSQEIELKKLSVKYDIPITIYFGSGHAAKFKENASK